jgi:hypothetical protein
MSRPNLGGTAEVSNLLGVSRQGVSNYRQRHPEFPEPWYDLACGPVYNLDEVAAWGVKTGRLVERTGVHYVPKPAPRGHARLVRG